MNNDNTKHNTDENNYVIMKIDKRDHPCNDGYGLLFFERWEGQFVAEHDMPNKQ